MHVFAKRFDHKVALITGAASGIGRATALRLSAEGAVLMLADIDEAGLQQTIELLTNSESAAFIKLDVSSSEQCRAAVTATVERWGKLDVLCNIAGIAVAKHLAEVSEEDWLRMMGINLNSVFFLSQAAMPHLIATKGNIVNMASSAALVGQIYNAAYCASKGAVVMLSKSMAVEFADRGVRVNAICPGAVKTALTEKFTMPDNANMDMFMRLMPLVDMAEADEIAGSVAYLASAEARYITGTTLAIDGGQTAN
ncbi:SDR family oxidoreductase [Zhongshania sp.]|jgi:meso-butanediol dehydrogenase/(S,S)-butanediol dehydrogenase/diacetyl reductase|uniref:SDR family NAD(P)-dependent oxidoreductase n=1 Tax=Zhongshania sp. TaxID=1971902 RepID=UPI002A804B3C|nr:SDR family oxidoreductase [Zhongshania sp.]